MTNDHQIICSILLIQHLGFFSQHIENINKKIKPYIKKNVFKAALKAHVLLGGHAGEWTLYVFMIHICISKVYHYKIFRHWFFFSLAQSTQVWKAYKHEGTLAGELL